MKPLLTPALTRLRVPLFACLLLGLAVPAIASADNTDITNQLVGKRQAMDCEASHNPSASRYNAWWAARHNPKQTGLLKLAQVPSVKWFSGIQERPTRHVERYLANLDDPQWGGRTCNTHLPYGQRDAYVGNYPIVAIRRLVDASCAGMKRTGNEYKTWIEAFIAQSQLAFIPDPGERYQYWGGKPFPRGRWVHVKRQMTVILEPDAIGLMGARRSCLRRSQVPGKLALLSYAARRLSETGYNVYIDGGSSSWLSKNKTIDYLRRGGVAYTRGFALGATHFNRTKREMRYGNSIARSLGKHFVINTAENANGSLPKRRWGKYGSTAASCNPRNSGLGTQPTTRTGSAYADAFLWISRPGLSSNGKKGSPPRCGKKNGPRGNIFWAKRGVTLSRQANFAKANWPPLPL